ncbi:hypothetical protein, partial [Xenorhabdus indica]|uniref:hypothetical protein n=1 Tax=Xenorhabdus indica TaxID=333964 RepID=UPI0021D5071E
MLKSRATERSFRVARLRILRFPLSVSSLYFLSFSRLSSRLVCVFVVTTDAHYREFSGADNSFF